MKVWITCRWLQSWYKNVVSKCSRGKAVWNSWCTLATGWPAMLSRCCRVSNSEAGKFEATTRQPITTTSVHSSTDTDADDSSGIVPTSSNKQVLMMSLTLSSLATNTRGRYVNSRIWHNYQHSSGSETCQKYHYLWASRKPLKDNGKVDSSKGHKFQDEVSLK